MKETKNKLYEEKKGITLIALVITIIVLLILAGVSIATLVGENGVIRKATTARGKAQEVEAVERVQTEVLGSYGEDGILDKEELRKNLSNIDGIDESTVPNSNDYNFPLTVTTDGVDIEIKDTGKVQVAFNAEEWDKTATPDNCFVWQSDDESNEGYNKIIGYTENIQNYPIVRVPSRCKIISMSGTTSETYTYRSFVGNIKKVELPETVIEIGNSAFANDGPESTKGFEKLETVVIPDSVTSIGYGAFDRCTGITDIDIPNNVTSIGNYAFSGCTGLTDITIPNDVISIESNAFSKCTGLTNITIPNSVTSIGDFAFFGCTGLTNITIPNSVTSIEVFAFSGCTGLTEITIPNSVKSMDSAIFSGCSNLKTIYVKGYSKAPSGWSSNWNEQCSAEVKWNQ